VLGESGPSSNRVETYVSAASTSLQGKIMATAGSTATLPWTRLGRDVSKAAFDQCDTMCRPPGRRSLTRLVVADVRKDCPARFLNEQGHVAPPKKSNVDREPSPVLWSLADGGLTRRGGKLRLGACAHLSPVFFFPVAHHLLQNSCLTLLQQVTLNWHDVSRRAIRRP
jgi:hypothetical protein